MERDIESFLQVAQEASSAGFTGALISGSVVIRDWKKRKKRGTCVIDL